MLGFMVTSAELWVSVIKFMKVLMLICNVSQMMVQGLTKSLHVELWWLLKRCIKK